MQFNNKIAVIYSSLNDFGEELEELTKTIKCCVIGQQYNNEETESGERQRYYLTLITKHKGFAPYKDLFINGDLRFRYKDIVYQPEKIEGINSSSGKLKFYLLTLRQTEPLVEV